MGFGLESESHFKPSSKKSFWPKEVNEVLPNWAISENYWWQIKSSPNMVTFWAILKIALLKLNLLCMGNF